MKKSFRAIICCLLAALVLSAGASHITSKPKVRFKSFHQIQVKEEDRKVLCGRDSDRVYFHIVMQSGSASFYSINPDNLRDITSEQRLVDNKLAGDTEADFMRRDGQQFMVYGERSGHVNDPWITFDCDNCEDEVSETQSPVR